MIMSEAGTKLSLRENKIKPLYNDKEDRTAVAKVPSNYSPRSTPKTTRSAASFSSPRQVATFLLALQLLVSSTTSRAAGWKAKLGFVMNDLHSPLSPGRIPSSRSPPVADEAESKNNRAHSVLHLVKFNSHRRKYGNDDEDDEDDDEIPSVDTADFVAPSLKTVVGLNRGRSAPSVRKAMGTSGSGTTSVHVCTNCGGETVKWMGRCPTCREWNTLQEFAVGRGGKAAGSGSGNDGIRSRPSFGGGRSSSSWLDGIASSLADGSPAGYMAPPVRVTDVIRDFTSGNSQNGKRIQIPNDEELTAVLGGGIMKGSLTLIGGDPGVGKSTLLLQTAAAVATLSAPTVGIGMGPAPTSDDPDKPMLGPVWYVSGEETTEQIASRAARLGLSQPELYLLSETQVDCLAEQVVLLTHPPVLIKPTSTMSEGDGDDDHISSHEGVPAPKPPSLIVVDSIQTMVCDAGGASAAGGITQVRECVALLLRLAKSTGIPIILVGHVTKSGDVAGPRTVEHMVDSVLYLEGGPSGGSGLHNLRLLRASKNRFGSSTQVGVYEMTAGSLLPVSDPSSLLLANRVSTRDEEGSAICLAMEGLRSMTVEVQALVTPSQTPRKTVEGISYSRLVLLLGVLQKRARVYCSHYDVFVNVVGRINLDKGEQAHSSDLAVVLALVSSLASIPVRADTAFCGEIGLQGELRTVPAIDMRVREARRMGFSRVVTPMVNGRGWRKGKGQSPSGQRTMVDGLEWIQCETVMEAINAGLVSDFQVKRRRKAPKKGKGLTSVPSKMEDLKLDVVDDGDDDEDDYYIPDDNDQQEFEDFA